MKNEMKNLIEEDFDLLDLIKKVLKSEGYDVKINNTNDIIEIELSSDNEEMESLIAYFEDYVNEIPDYMIHDVMLEFKDNIDISLAEFDDLLDGANPKDKEKVEDLIAVFKDAVNTIAQKYVEELTEKYIY